MGELDGRTRCRGVDMLTKLYQDRQEQGDKI